MIFQVTPRHCACQEPAMSAAEFAAFHLRVVAADEARYGMLCTALTAIGTGQTADTLWWTLGGPGSCALWKPGRPLLVGNLDTVQAGALFGEAGSLPYHAVSGLRSGVSAYVRSAVACGQRFAAPLAYGFHELREAPRFPQIEGSAHVACVDDTELLARWTHAFSVEATPHDPVADLARIRQIAEQGDVILWTVTGQPVAKSVIVRRTENSGAISGVYTPPGFRCRGYAGAATAAAVARIFAEGRQIAYLYTNLANPASNRCYAKIGFRQVGETTFQPRLS